VFILLVIVLAVQKWRHYLLGNHFVIRTDQRSLKYLLEQRMLDGNQQKWVAKLLGYDFEIQYKEGKENRVADALSRVVSLQAISMVSSADWSIIVEETTQDEKLQRMIQELVVDPKSHPSFEFRKGCLWYKNRLVIPSKSSKIPLILEEFHNSLWGGHSEGLRTFKRVANVFY
jgi:hypothetical protein